MATDLELALAGTQRAELGVCTGYSCAHVERTGEGIEHIALMLRVDQLPGIVLTEHTHQSCADIREDGGGDRRSIDPRARPPITTDFAFEHQRFVVGVDPTLVEHRPQGRHRARLEHALHGRPVGAASYPIGRRTFAEEHSQRADDQ